METGKRRRLIHELAKHQVEEMDIREMEELAYQFLMEEYRQYSDVLLADTYEEYFFGEDE